MAYRGEDAGATLEAPTADGNVSVNLGPNRLALAVGAGARYAGLDRDRAFYSLILAVVGSYDIAFAISSGDTSAILFEVGVEALLVIVMVVGFRTSLWWIVGGLAAHGLLDAVHSELIVNRGIPAWWPAFCATFDVVAAAVLAKQLALPARQSFSHSITHYS